MTADEVIAIRKLWDKYNYRNFLPEATVLASTDWLNYVLAMTEAVPKEVESVNYPTEEEAQWAWPEGVTIVLESPLPIVHNIVSKQEAPMSMTMDTPPHDEEQVLSGLIFGIGQEVPTRIAHTDRMADPIYCIPIMWIGNEPSDIVTSQWMPGGSAFIFKEKGAMAESTAFVLSVITALGHRLTKSVEPRYVSTLTPDRGQRRRVQRELPHLRVLTLSSGASVRSQEGAGARAWSRRWLVRGHWHTVAYGPQKALRRLQWYDPYVKGPEDKPFDDRRTVWRT